MHPADRWGKSQLPLRGDMALSALGELQATALDGVWSSSIETENVPIPDVFYCSPLRCCLQTLQLSSYFAMQGSISPRQIVKEGLRDRFGVTTHDQRSSKSWIKKNYPTFTLEDGFTQVDELWKPDIRESLENQMTRVSRLLDDVFNDSTSMFVSLTTHCQLVSTLMIVTGGERLPVLPGKMYTLFVAGQNL